MSVAIDVIEVLIGLAGLALTYFEGRVQYRQKGDQNTISRVRWASSTERAVRRHKQAQGRGRLARRRTRRATQAPAVVMVALPRT